MLHRCYTTAQHRDSKYVPAACSLRVNDTAWHPLILVNSRHAGSYAYCMHQLQRQKPTVAFISSPRASQHDDDNQVVSQANLSTNPSWEGSRLILIQNRMCKQNVTGNMAHGSFFCCLHKGREKRNLLQGQGGQRGKVNLLLPKLQRATIDPLIRRLTETTRFLHKDFLLPSCCRSSTPLGSASPCRAVGQQAVVAFTVTQNTL